MPDWSIKIEGIPPAFTPDIEKDPPIPPGTPLKVVQGDLVSWDNLTNHPHWPTPDDPATYGQFMTEAVAPDSSSTAYNIVSPAGTVINYHCSIHPLLRGQIIVVNFGEN